MDSKQFLQQKIVKNSPNGSWLKIKVNKLMHFIF